MSANEAAPYLQEIASRLRALLGRELVGVYAGGSFVLGGYAPERSDLDVAAVCRTSLARELKTEIGDALRHESLPCPARGLEFVLYPESSIRQPAEGAGFELDLNSGREMPFRLATDSDSVARHWYVIDRAILREHGEAIHGPGARELFEPIPREVLLRALVESVRWHEASPYARRDDAVLNACRAWRFSTETVWSSKHEAGLWARTTLEDSSLVLEALAARNGDDLLDAGRVAAFLRRARRRLESVT